MGTSAPPTVIRVLTLVDNDDDDEFLIRRALRKGGMNPQIIRLRGGKDAIVHLGQLAESAATQGLPGAEVVFLDINMPGLSGFDVLAWMKQRRLSVRPFVAILSSSDLAQDRRRALELGANCYLIKPPTAEGLRRFAESHGMQWPAA